MKDQRRQSIYLPAPMLAEIQEAARLQDRPLSWIIQKAWKLARAQILALPPAIDDDQAELASAPALPHAEDRFALRRLPARSLDQIGQRADARRRAIGQPLDAPEPFDDIDLDPDAPDAPRGIF